MDMNLIDRIESRGWVDRNEAVVRDLNSRKLAWICSTESDGTEPDQPVEPKMRHMTCERTDGRIMSVYLIVIRGGNDPG